MSKIKDKIDAAKAAKAAQVDQSTKEESQPEAAAPAVVEEPKKEEASGQVLKSYNRQGFQHAGGILRPGPDLVMRPSTEEEILLCKQLYEAGKLYVAE